MMKKLILFAVVCLMLSATVARAQESEVGVKGGLNLSSISVDYGNDKNLKAGFFAGVYNKIPLGNTFALQPELLYSVKGVKYNYNNTFSNSETKVNLNYIDLPVKMVFNLSKNFDVQFGPYVSYLLNGDINTSTEVLNYYSQNSNKEIDRKDFNALDYGLSAGVGFDLESMLLGVNYNVGLNQVAKDGTTPHNMMGNAKNNVLQFYVGFKF
ncbi:porin family protein [Prolixibacter sp. NT017]|uniref:porin family protein n=1 Tax=Prolixibacter sp. NT017 TaxID=2652390 RepID=UPI001282C649|nr:porin family protein [Prolixibacter sp. NT017]GET25015.1 hypothetical protein NT017_13440 [Prolixibacter sp. NT017]